MPACPKFPPLKLNVTDPVLAALAMRTLEREPRSYEYASDTVPDSTPDVIMIRRVPPTPALTLQTTQLSDTHTLASHDDAPTRPAVLPSKAPNLDPYTVTLADPVAARLDGRDTLTAGASYDAAKLTLPTRMIAVMDTRRLWPIPLLPLQSTELSDTHVLASHALTPRRA